MPGRRSELATQFDLNPNQIKQWKDQLLDGVSDMFDDKLRGRGSRRLDLSRFDAAPLIAFTATKEIDYGTETDGRF